MYALVEVTCAAVGNEAHPAPSKIRIAKFFASKAEAAAFEDVEIESPTSYMGQNINYLVWNLASDDGLNIDRVAQPGKKVSNCGAWLDFSEDHDRIVSDLTQFELVASEKVKKRASARADLERKANGTLGRSVPQPGKKRSTRSATTRTHETSRNVGRGGTFGNGYRPLQAHQ